MNLFKCLSKNTKVDADIISNDKGNLCIVFNDDASFLKGDQIVLSLDITINTFVSNQFIGKISNDK